MQIWIWLSGCGVLPLDRPIDVARVVYDPTAGDIPTPNDLARDDDAEHLDLPIDDTMSSAEAALRTALNLQDGWSSTSTISLTVDADLDPETVANALQLWEWGVTPARVTDLDLSVDGGEISITPPPTGWAQGGRYLVALAGGEDGPRTSDGRPVGPDAAFFYLRADQALDDHPRAFPGSDRATRQASADALEVERIALAPYVDFLVSAGTPRDDLAAAFTFTVTRRPELAMDSASHRMPIPFDLLIDPVTGLVDLPPDVDDDVLEADAKTVLNTFDGFGLTAPLTFETTGPIDPSTVTDDTVQLWDLTLTPVRVPATLSVWREAGLCTGGELDCVHVLVDPVPNPLTPATTYALLVRDGLLDPFGQPLAPMAVGHVLTLDAPVSVDGVSVVSVLDDVDAARLEAVRAKVDVLLDSQGRDGLVTAWPFTTFDRLESLRADVRVAEESGYDASPTVTDRGDANRLFGADPLTDLFPGLLNPADVFYLPRVDGVAEVIEGTIPVPVHLDPVTRRWREPAVMDDVHFLATIPAGVPTDEPVPVVIFTHAIVTDRRFLLTLSGELAKRGFAAVAIDMPYHGERIACIEASLVAVPNFFPPALQPLVGFTDTMIWLPPCVSGDAATCAPTGECLGPDGQVEPFNSFPIIDIRPASGAAFLDVQDLPHVPDHFRQALVDLGALRWSLQSADWSTALGREIRTDSFLFAGQSLGAILGAVYVPADPHIARAVLNVPGADVVTLFDDSTFFGPQMSEYLVSIDVVEGTWEHQRLLLIAHWLLDSVDPLSVAHVWQQESDRVEGLIQIDRVSPSLGDLVIPNRTSDALQAASGLPMTEYPSVLHADLVVPLIGDEMLRELADFLAEGN